MVVGDFTTDTQVLVIGGGPAGYTAAIRASQLGKEVILVEQGKLGGVCLNQGCIPSKALLSATARLSEREKLGGMGIIVPEAGVDFTRMQSWKESVVSRLTGGVARLLRSNNVTVVEGEALLSAEDVARVITEHETGRCRFEACVVATGARPVPPASLPRHPGIITSSQALCLGEVPERLIVWGSGYIEVEVATIFGRLGSEVTLLSPEARLLPAMEPSTVRMLDKNLKRMGVETRMQVEGPEYEAEEDRVLVRATVKGVKEEWTADTLVADGKYEPNVEELALQAAGVETDASGFIRVDDRQRTTNPRVYAVGDVAGEPFLAHKGSYEGKVAAEVISGRLSGTDAIAIPVVVYGEPELAKVGMTEEEAREAGHEVTVGSFPFGASGRALTMGIEEGTVRVVAERGSGAILGIHLAGTGASELVAEAAHAIEMQATLEDLALTVHAHPTLSEMVLEAAEAAMGLAINMPARRAEPMGGRGIG